MIVMPLRDPVLEADRILEAAEAEKIVTRLLGGVGVAKHLHQPLPAELVRPYGDIDLLVAGRQSRKLRDLLTALGYEANRPFNALHGERRLQFFDPDNERHLDVLVDVFEMCHQLEPLPLTTHAQTLATTDLLLTKLQVVQVTEKDLIDACTLVLQHEVATGTGDALDTERLSDVARKDWGWFTTISDNFARLSDFATSRLVSDSVAPRVIERIGAMRLAVEAAPKTLKWKARAAVGRRVPWYVLPEEPNKA